MDEKKIIAKYEDMCDQKNLILFAEATVLSRQSVDDLKHIKLANSYSSPYEGFYWMGYRVNSEQEAKELAVRFSETLGISIEYKGPVALPSTRLADIRQSKDLHKAVLETLIAEYLGQIKSSELQPVDYAAIQKRFESN